MRIPLLFLALIAMAGCSTTPAVSQNKPDLFRNDIYDPPGYGPALGDVNAAALVQYAPVYPKALRIKNASGSAVVEFVVDVDGSVTSAWAVTQTNDLFGAAAVAAVKKWKFTPARHAGIPIVARMQVPIYFTLNEPAPADAADLSNSSSGDVQPKPLFQPSPIYPPELIAADTAGSVLVQFIVELDGSVSSATIVTQTNALFGAAALAAVKQWTFEPGRKAGVPVRCRMEVPLNFALQPPVGPSTR